MIEHLFVYGTLMRAASASTLGRDMRARLDAQGDWLGAATIAGQLFALDRYPALVASQQAADIVHGEVYRLRDPAASLAWLDTYEGLPAGKTRGDEYERSVRQVTLASGPTIDAWVYTWLGDPTVSRRILAGRWLPEASARHRAASD